MKKINLIQLLLFIMVIMINVNCKKDSTSPYAKNTPPKANTGSDIQVLLPVNSCGLIGTAHDDENNISSFQWTKIAGPSSFTIVKPTALQTTVINLVEGIYEFELKVTDAGSLWSKDSIKITVNGNTGELIFNNLTWIPDFYTFIEISNINSRIPPATLFRVYIQRDFNPAWIEVNPITNNGSGSPYEYFIATTIGTGHWQVGSLIIVGSGLDFSDTDTPNVKIVF